MRKDLRLFFKVYIWVNFSALISVCKCFYLTAHLSASREESGEDEPLVWLLPMSTRSAVALDSDILSVSSGSSGRTTTGVT